MKTAPVTSDLIKTGSSFAEEACLWAGEHDHVESEQSQIKHLLESVV